MSPPAVSEPVQTAPEAVQTATPTTNQAISEPGAVAPPSVQPAEGPVTEAPRAAQPVPEQLQPQQQAFQPVQGSLSAQAPAAPVGMPGTIVAGRIPDDVPQAQGFNPSATGEH